MNDQQHLFEIYNRELGYLRRLTREFAARHPDAARRLQILEGGETPDPHVERLIEGFAYLAARVHKRLDDDFPQLTEGLLQVLYPHYLAPLPSMAIVEFDIDRNRTVPEPVTIPRHSTLDGPRMFVEPGNQEMRCEFRTAYALELWPVELTAAQLLVGPRLVEAQPPRVQQRIEAALRLDFTSLTPGGFSDLTALQHLRLHLYGEGPVVGPLYEVLLNRAVAVRFTPLTRHDQLPLTPLMLPPKEVLAPVGFAEDEALLPYPKTSFVGYRLLTEYFAYHRKFMFINLGGWSRCAAAGFGQRVRVDIFFDRAPGVVEQSVDTGVFRLNCVPAMNLFPKTCDAIVHSYARHAYRLEPDGTQPLNYEVYSVSSVSREGQKSDFVPFFSYRHGVRESGQAFWAMTRCGAIPRHHVEYNPSEAEDRGTDVLLQFVDLNFEPTEPAGTEKLVAETLCTNRDRAQQLGTKEAGFSLELRSGVQPCRCIRPPTPVLRPPLKLAQYWRLLSHLNLNHLSITGGTPEVPDPEGRAVLQEILRLYDFGDSSTAQGDLARQAVEGILEIRHQRVAGRIGADFVRGVEIEVNLDPAKYAATGVYLFASVLEHFLGLYATINSFTQLVVKINQRDVLKRWPPRAGALPLL